MISRHGEITIIFISFSVPASLPTPAPPATTKKTVPRDYNGLHFIQCACKFTDTCTTCNNENRSKRVEIKELIQTLKQVNPYVEGNIFKSVENVNLDTVVCYKKDGERHWFLDDYDEK